MIFLHTACASLLLFTIALLMGKHKKISDYILMVWLVIFLSNLATFYIITYYPFPLDFWKKLLVEFSDSSVFLHGPIFWFYAISLSKPSIRLNRNILYHFIPFVVIFTFISSGVLYVSAHMNTIIKTLIVLKFTSLFAYAVIVFLLLQAHRLTVKNIFSNTEQKYLSWLRFLSLGIIMLWSVAFATTLLNWVSFVNSVKFDSILFQVSVDLFIVVMSYFGFQQKALYESNLEYHEEEIASLQSISGKYSESKRETISKYQKSGLSEQRVKELHLQLLSIMAVEQVFIDEDLTLFKLAVMLKISPNHLSQVINTMEKCNFFDFVNLFRVEEVKKGIFSKKYEHFTLSGIAFDCGFNSKAAFNRAFKKFTGITPTEFRKRVV